MANDPIDFKAFKEGKGIRGGGGELPPGPPPIFQGPKLPQILYRIITVDKVTGGETVHDRRGHIVVTASNIVLFDENQEMTWGIPNDDFVISFERMEDGHGEGYQDVDYEELTVESDEFDDNGA